MRLPPTNDDKARYACHKRKTLYSSGIKLFFLLIVSNRRAKTGIQMRYAGEKIAGIFNLDFVQIRAI